MVNIRSIGKKFTEAEGKQLLEGAQKIIDEKIAGPKIRRDKLLKGDKVKKEKVLIDGKNYETVDGEYQAMKARDGAYVREKFFGKNTPSFNLIYENKL